MATATATTVYAVRRTLVKAFREVVPAGVTVSFGPTDDQKLVGDFVWLGTSTDGSQDARAVSGPGRKWDEEFEVPVRIWSGGKADAEKNEARAEEIHHSIQCWLDAHPRLDGPSDVLAGSPLREVPGAREAQIVRFEIDNFWTKAGGPVTVAELYVQVKARGGPK